MRVARVGARLAVPITRFRCRVGAVGAGGVRGRHDQRLFPGRALGVRAAPGLHLCVPAEGAPTAHLAPVRAQGHLGSLPQGCCDWDPPARGCVHVLSSHGLLRPCGKVTTWGRAGNLRET